MSSLAAGLGASLVSGIGTEELVFYDGLNLLIPSVNYYLSGNNEAYYTLLWSSIFVTLVAKKYHESVTLPSGLRMVYDNH